MENKKSKKRLIKWGIILSIIIVIIVLVIWFLGRLNKPVSSKVKLGLGQSTQTSYNIDLTPVQQIGNYISFNHPKGVPLTNTSLISPISVEDFDYYVKDVYSWSLAIDVIQTPTGQLNQSSSYNLRAGNHSTYSEASENIGGQQVTIFTDTSFTEGFSKVAYIQHENYIGIVSLVGNDTSGTTPLDTSFNMILNSFTWLK